MTVNTSTSTASYIGNGVTVGFPIPFYWLVDTDIKVSKKVAATGVVSVLTLNSDYTLTGAGNGSGGTMTMAVAPAAGDSLYVERSVTIVQQTAYPTNGPFPASSHERALDRLTMIAQELKSTQALALVRDPLGSTYDLEAGTLINSGAAVQGGDVPNLTQVQTLVTATGSGIIPSLIATYTNLATSVGSSLIGFLQAGVNAVLRTTQAKLREVEISITDFGADPTGVAACDTAWARAQASLPLTGGRIVFPAGTFRFTSTMVIGNAVATLPSTLNGVIVEGKGGGRDAVRMNASDATTRILYDGTAGGTVVSIQGPISGVTIRDLMIDGNNKAATFIHTQRSFMQTVRNVHCIRWTNGYGFRINANSTLNVASYGGAAPVQHLYEMVTFADPGVGGSGVSIGEGAGNLNQLEFNRCYFDRYNDTQTVGLRLGYCDHISFFGCHFVMTGSAGSTGISVYVDAQAGNLGFPANINFYGTTASGGVGDSGAWNGTTYAALHFWPFYTADGAPVPPKGANGTALNPNLVRGFTDLNSVIGWRAIQSDNVAAAATIAPVKDLMLLTGTSVTVNTITPPRSAGVSTGCWKLTIIPSGTSLALGTAGNIAEAFSLTNYRAVTLTYSEGTGKWHRVAG
jgi:hypothetical protein